MKINFSNIVFQGFAVFLCLPSSIKGRKYFYYSVWIRLKEMLEIIKGTSHVFRFHFY